MEIELLDYLLDEDDNFWLVTDIEDNIFGYIIYQKDTNGTRYNNITKQFYTKQKYKKEEIPKGVKNVFKPQQFYLEHKQELKGIWKDYVDVLNQIGIKDSDIGIFGSYLIGFDVIKDVDFVIYGYENLLKYHKNIDKIHKQTKTTPITKEHISYQYEKFKDQYNENCDLLEMIGRNWSAIQIKKGVLSTPRFILKDKQKAPLYAGEKRLVSVKIKEGITTTCFPRRCKCEYNNEEYEIYTTLWKYQSFAKDGETIEIYGIVDDMKKTIIINDIKEHYLRFV